MPFLTIKTSFRTLLMKCGNGVDVESISVLKPVNLQAIRVGYKTEDRHSD